MRNFEAYYDPGTVRRAVEVTASLIADYYAATMEASDRVVPRQTPREVLDAALAEMHAVPIEARPSALIERFHDLAKLFLDRSQKLHDPRYMGHQVPAVVPFAALFDGLTKLTNQGLALFEMGPFASAAERALIETLGTRLGWRKGAFDAIATSGGTLANTTAILAARNHHFPEAWERGVTHARQPAIVASSDAHYSIARAAGTIGIGADHVLKAPLDARRRMDPEALVTLLDDAKARGLEVFCIVGSASSTATGSFDPLRAIGALARARGIWFHVDGAHGASFALSPKLKAKLDGVELADSVTWDAHKMLFVPSLSTFLFYREKAKSYVAFKQEAPYLDDPDAPGLELFDGYLRTFECTKGGISVGLWGLWAMGGERLFQEIIETTTETTDELYRLLEASEDFDALHAPECNILCFRHVPAAMRGESERVLSELQARIRKALLNDGRFYITSTVLQGSAALRVVVMNPLTRKEHLQGLLEKIRESAQVR